MDPSATVEVDYRSALRRNGGNPRHRSQKRVHVRWLTCVGMSEDISWQRRVVDTSWQSPARYGYRIRVHELCCTSKQPACTPGANWPDPKVAVPGPVLTQDWCDTVRGALRHSGRLVIASGHQWCRTAANCNSPAGTWWTPGRLLSRRRRTAIWCMKHVHIDMHTRCDVVTDDWCTLLPPDEFNGIISVLFPL